MQAPANPIDLVRGYMRGDVRELSMPTALALAARTALRLEPSALALTSRDAAMAAPQLVAYHAAVLAALAASGSGVAPSIARLVARLLSAPDPASDPWPDPSEPDPGAVAVALAAAAAAATPDAGAEWVARVLVAAAGLGDAPHGDRWEGLPLVKPDTSQVVIEAAQDFAAAAENGRFTEPERLLAQPLWREEKERELEAYHAWSRAAHELGVDWIVEQYDGLRAGKPLPPRTLQATLNDWLNGRLRGSPPAQSASAEAAMPGPAVQMQGTVGAGQTKAGFEQVRTSSLQTDAGPGVSAASKAPPGGQEARVSLAMFSDEPLMDERADVLDFKPYADALAGLITNPTTATPLTLAINAPWGSGKSTLARMVQRRLVNSPAERSGLPHVTCWFDAWAHDDADDLTGAFVATVAQAAAAARPPWRRLLFPVPKALLEPAARARRHALQGLVILLAILSLAIVLVWIGAAVGKPFDAIKLPGSVAPIVLVASTALLILRELAKAAKEVGDFIRDPKSVAATGSVSAVRQQLRRLIDEATRGDRRLVAFIDDLERCRPPRPVELLEVVNQLLAHPNVVTVILADIPAVAACVEIKYRDLAERYRPTGSGAAGQLDARQAYGRLYLQKIVQLQFDVPPHTPERIRNLVSALVSPPGPTPAPPVPAHPRATSTWLSRTIDRMLGAGDPIVARMRYRQARVVRQRAAEFLREGGPADAEELARSIAAPVGMSAAALQNIARETVQRSLVEQRSEVWQLAQEEATRHVPLLPRNAKRLVNRLRLLIFIAQERRMFLAERDVTARRIGKWAVLCERWPELAQALATDPRLVHQLEAAAPTRRGGGFNRLVAGVAPAHAGDEELRPFWASKPRLEPILAALLHMQSTPVTSLPRNATPDPAATTLPAGSDLEGAAPPPPANAPVNVPAPPQVPVGALAP